MSLPLSLDLSAAWAAAAGILLALGILVATIRKSLENFSRKLLLDRLPFGHKQRFEGYLDRLEDHAVSLRILDQILRLSLVGCAALAFVNPAAAAGGPLDRLAAFAALVLSVLAAVLVGLELIPAVLSEVAPEAQMVRVLPVLDGLHRLSALPIRIFRALAGAGARALGSNPDREAAAMVEEGILSAVEEGEREGILQQPEISMIESIIRFRDREVSDVHTPRTDMVSLEASTPVSECVRKAIECGHSRIPVYRDNRDNIIGILYAKDLLRLWERRGDDHVPIEEMIRKPHFVPETKKISELLHEFKTQRFHIAIVVDEFGGTSGLITIEDIVEEILGEIVEEYELEESRRVVRIREDLIEVDARVPVHEINHQLDDDLPVRIPEGDGFETIGGFIFSSLGRIPRVGESYQFGPLRFEVVAADDRSIRRLSIAISRPGSPLTQDPNPRAEHPESLGKPS